MSLRWAFPYSKEMNAFTAKVQVAQKRTREEILLRYVWMLGAALAVFIFADVLEAGTIRAMMPMTRIVPIVLWRHEDGPIEAVVTENALAQPMLDRTIMSMLWTYTMMRESFSTPTIDWNHHIVEAMSTVQVADDFNKWVSAKNPKSYQNLYGPQHPGEADRCTVSVTGDPDDMTNPKRVYHPPGPNGSTPGTYIFHIWRWVNCRDEPFQHAVEFTAAVTFIAGYRGTLKLADVIQFNPLRLVVTGYAPLEPVGSPPKDILR